MIQIETVIFVSLGIPTLGAFFMIIGILFSSAQVSHTVDAIHNPQQDRVSSHTSPTTKHTK